MHQNAFGGRAPPGPLGELERSPRPPSRNEGCLLLREGKGEGKGREGGEGREGKGREGGEGREGRGPTRFLTPSGAYGGSCTYRRKASTSQYLIVFLIFNFTKSF